MRVDYSPTANEGDLRPLSSDYRHRHLDVSREVGRCGRGGRWKRRGEVTTGDQGRSMDEVRATWRYGLT